MYFRKISFLAVTITVLCSCASSPEARIASWEDWELCHRLADFVYRGESQWHWHAANAITARNLANDQRCKSIYEARINEYIRKNERADISISFVDALRNSRSFNDVIPKSSGE